MRFLNDYLKSPEVDFPQSSLIHYRINEHPRALLIVDRVVFQTCAHPLRLNTLNEARGHLSSQDGILGKVLKVSTAKWVSFDVDARAQQNRHVFFYTLFPQRDPDLMHQLDVPGTRERRRGRETGSRNARIKTNMISLTILFAKTVRAIGDHNRR